jgi:mRNA interferase MazF
MVRPAYIPERGDAIWLDFDPQAGREQAGRRPALVLSGSVYNRKSGLALVCPITSQVKGYPFESLVPEGLPIQGVVLTDQIRSLDWQRRRAKFIVRIPEDLLQDVTAKLAALLALDDN